MLNPFFEWCIRFARGFRFWLCMACRCLDVFSFGPAAVGLCYLFFWNPCGLKFGTALSIFRKTGSTNSVIDEYLNSYCARY